MESTDSGSDRRWYLLGKAVPKSEIVFAVQVIIIYIIIITAVVNLTLNGSAGESKIWIVLLSSCLGYILPSPTIKKNGSL
jgi:hypothetical protein